jgi:hypothetical protein
MVECAENRCGKFAGSDVKSLIVFVQARSTFVSSERSIAGLALRVDGQQQYAKRTQRVLKINALQQTATKVFPVELEEPSEPPLNTAKNSAPFTGTIKSVERIVGPNATGETKHIVIDHEGKLPYWEGQSYGIIPPVRLFPQKGCACGNVMVVDMLTVVPLSVTSEKTVIGFAFSSCLWVSFRVKVSDSERHKHSWLAPPRASKGSDQTASMVLY